MSKIESANLRDEECILPTPDIILSETATSWERLGLPVNAGLDLVNGNYRRLIGFYHPDRYKGKDADKIALLLNIARDEILDTNPGEEIDYVSLFGYGGTDDPTDRDWTIHDKFIIHSLDTLDDLQRYKERLLDQYESEDVKYMEIDKLLKHVEIRKKILMQAASKEIE